MAHPDRAERTALIAYGTVSGNAQETAEEVGRLARRLKFASRISELNDISLNDLLRYTVVVFVVSTTGQGDLPTNATLFWKRLRSAKLKPDSLAALQFASFGIGDSSYPQFNWAHRKLNNRLRQLGAVEFTARGESDEQSSEGLEGLFASWYAQLKDALLQQCPLPIGEEPIQDDVFLEPDWVLQTCNATIDESSTSADSASISHCIEAEVVSNERLTPQSHWQDVRMFELLTPKVDYSPGDTLTVYPKNCSEDVTDLISLMGWDSVADENARFCISGAASSARISFPVAQLPRTSNTTLRQLLQEQLDITAVPRRSFFANIAHFASNQEQKDRLLEFTDVNLIDELYDYTTRARRSILEVLQEFDSVRIPFKYAAAVFPTIRGRLFSIASGGHLKTSADGRTRFQLLIAIIRYRTVIRRIRYGLCTRYLTGLQLGDRLTVTLSQSPQMRVSYDRPALMIGPGTGVAPLRSMIHERRALSTNDLPQMLIFGCRNQTADYFFADEWRSMTSDSKLDIIPAFSRDQASKVYVQDVIRSQAATVNKLLQDGVVYVCGSSGKMPEAVREAITFVIQSEGSVTRAEAESRFQLLQKEGRYQQETW